ncbi:hypothetical protein CEXT_272511, partial [Caerostris extrusa]
LSTEEKRIIRTPKRDMHLSKARDGEKLYTADGMNNKRDSCSNTAYIIVELQLHVFGGRIDSELIWRNVES